MSKWHWGDESAKTKAEIEQQIAEHLCEVLCDGDCGSVIGPDEKTHNIHVRATVMVNDRMPPSANARARRRIRHLERCLGDVYRALYTEHRELCDVGEDNSAQGRLMHRLRMRIERTVPDPWKA